MAGRLVRVLDGEDRVSHGWGWLTLFAPAALALFLFQLVEDQGHPPHRYAWVWPLIWVCVLASLVGLYLLLAPTIRGWLGKTPSPETASESPVPPPSGPGIDVPGEWESVSKGSDGAERIERRTLERILRVHPPPAFGQGVAMPANVASADRLPLVLTLKQVGTYAEFEIHPYPARPLVGVHVAVYAANPGDVPVTLLGCRLEHIAVRMSGTVQYEGFPDRPAPLPHALPGVEAGTVSMDSDDPDFAHPPVVHPGQPHLVHALFFVPVGAPSREGHTVPQAIWGTVILVDELQVDHPLADEIACHVSMGR